jgi:sugar phosphate isomerase/epimerase
MSQSFPFRTALNASTLFPFGLDLPRQAAVAAQAGFDALELWVKDIDAFVQAGGSLAELRAAIAASGVELANAIAFFRWADTDEATREQGFAQAEREMRMLAEIGCPAVAAPPFGDVAGSTLEAIGEHFARLVALGRGLGVEPYLEFWGRAARLSRLDEAVEVAQRSGVVGARLLLDPFHMYTGGSPVGAVGALGDQQIGIVHVNDYPAQPARDLIGDQDRVLPGEGIAPSAELARLLARIGYRGYLSLELFRPGYGAAGALDVARRGLQAIHAAYSIEDVSA